jgi:hypothetical protein
MGCAREQRRRHRETERLGCLEVHDQLERGRLQVRQIGGLVPLRIWPAYVPVWRWAPPRLAP